MNDVGSATFDSTLLSRTPFGPRLLKSFTQLKKKTNITSGIWCYSTKTASDWSDGVCEVGIIRVLILLCDHPKEARVVGA